MAPLLLIISWLQCAACQGPQQAADLFPSLYQQVIDAERAGVDETTGQLDFPVAPGRYAVSSGVPLIIYTAVNITLRGDYHASGAPATRARCVGLRRRAKHYCAVPLPVPAACDWDCLPCTGALFVEAAGLIIMDACSLRDSKVSMHACTHAGRWVGG